MQWLSDTEVFKGDSRNTFINQIELGVDCVLAGHLHHFELIPVGNLGAFGIISNSMYVDDCTYPGFQILRINKIMHTVSRSLVRYVSPPGVAPFWNVTEKDFAIPQNRDISLKIQAAINWELGKILIAQKKESNDKIVDKKLEQGLNSTVTSVEVQEKFEKVKEPLLPV